MKLRFTGLTELKAEMKDQCRLEPVKRIVLLNGAEMQQKAMRNAPVDTGTLKRSISLSLEDKGLTARAYTTVEYAPYQEYGTRFINAHPFMKPAFNEQKQIFKNDLENLTK